jgi:hypothetical protein
MLLCVLYSLTYFFTEKFSSHVKWKLKIYVVPRKGYID